MPKSDRAERRIQDMERVRIKFPDPKYGQPPFDNEKAARAYITAVHKYKEEDIQRLLRWYMPTLYPCGCPDEWSDQRYGLNNRLQYDCGNFYRCSKCGEERNPDGSKHKRHYRSDVDVKEEKLDSEQLNLLDWKDGHDE